MWSGFHGIISWCSLPRFTAGGSFPLTVLPLPPEKGVLQLRDPVRAKEPNPRQVMAAHFSVARVLSPSKEGTVYQAMSSEVNPFGHLPSDHREEQGPVAWGFCPSRFHSL